MKNFFRFASLLLFPVLTLLTLPVQGAALRIGDASCGSALSPLRQALVKSGNSGDRSLDNEFSIIRMTPQAALEQLAAGKLELIVLEKRDIPPTLREFSRCDFAAEALVCYTGAGNPIQSLSIRQLKEIWGEERPVWRKYNGEFNDIHLLGLDFHHGGFPEARFLGGSLRINGVFRTRGVKRAWLFCSPSALLCAPWYDEIPADIKRIAIDGVNPSRKNIVSGAYPLNLRYELIGKRKLSPEAEKFIKLLRTPEYSAIIHNCGLIPMLHNSGGEK